MSAEQTLTAAIEAIIQEKTFSLDALTAIQAIKERAAKLEIRASSLDMSLKDERYKTTRLEVQLDGAEKKLTEWEKRSLDITSREATQNANAQALVAAQAELLGVKWMAEKFLANRQTREMAVGAAPAGVATPGGSTYPMVMTGSTSSDTTRTEG